MSLITQPSTAFHGEKIHSYDQYVKGNETRFTAVSSLLAKTMLEWSGDKLSTAKFTADDLARELGVKESQSQLFVALLKTLVRSGHLSEVDGWYTLNAFDSASLDRLVASLYNEGLSVLNLDQQTMEAIRPGFELARICIPNLPAVLQGELSGVQLLFSADNFAYSTAIYGDHIQEVYYGLIAEQIVKKCFEIWSETPDRQIRILEIGAGSGKGTMRMLEALRPYGNRVHFCFTDIGNSFLRRAKQAFKDFDFSFDFRLLDIGQDPEAQGFSAESFDIAFATNVLHATPDLRDTLRNTAWLLAPQGNVYINEIAHDLAVNTVSFGTTPGWWLPDDGLRLPYSPVATTQTYRALLQSLNFERISIVGYPGVSEAELVQAIIHGVKK
ncbi:class I SAM-dependent methyltransferase [Neolewinella lacunae]|uniref:Class I SAM-dependent methyltransferase n=1 Tax=Neolewinella lacunae TaxID=1517758 RepID=A0A923TF50_9BACT|nr:class I SAM-dependent methyltransferase [Neolewinella lacunae]MBC6996627.1 class I SAM-dependent methyltransferase [Neolewinella lacunae]MDN3634809.1 class I SAM-dependent methyltransferase [Neolewinella lacunae]